MYALKHPRKDWEVREGVPTLERKQKIVGGYIEHIFIPELENPKATFYHLPQQADDLLNSQINIFANEEGRLKNLPPNIVTQDGTLLVGTILASRFNCDGETVSLIDGDLELLQKMEAWEL